MRDPLTAEAQRQLQELREEYEWAEQYLHHQYEGMQRALLDLYRRKVAGVATQQQALNVSSPAAVLGAAADSLHKEDAPAPTASHDVLPRSVLPLSDTARDALECDVDIEPEQPTVKRAVRAAHHDCEVNFLSPPAQTVSPLIGNLRHTRMRFPIINKSGLPL